MMASTNLMVRQNSHLFRHGLSDDEQEPDLSERNPLGGYLSDEDDDENVNPDSSSSSSSPHRDGAGGGGTSSSITTSQNDGGPNGGRDEVHEIKKLIQDETASVRRWRWVVVMAMLVVSATVTTATYWFLEQEETSDFETSFQQFATTIVESSQFSATTIRSTCSDFADFVTSGALQDNATWPFYTIPNWSVRAANLLRQTESFGTWIAPEVPTRDLSPQWTQYVLANAGWYQGPPFVPAIFYLFNGSLAFDLDRDGPYRPIWQIYPLSAVINNDLTTRPVTKANVDNANELQEGLVGGLLNKAELEPVFPHVNNFTEDPREPFASYYQPIFDSFDESSRRIVANLQLFIRWGVYFSGKLPDGVEGINLVLSSTTCNVTFTWELVGRKAVFLNATDVHDTAYDSQVISSPFNTYENIDLAKELGVCFYTISIYPSSTFEDSYRSQTPIVVTCIVGAVFFSMMAAFLAYDNFQRKRNIKVVANAAKSNALVTSLFPNNVRDRLLMMDEPNEGTEQQGFLQEPHPAGQHKSTKGSHAFFKTNRGQLKTYVDGGKRNPGSQLEDGTEVGDNHTNSKPIADLFLETTILFADITGFTAWSSVREPSQVFTLLETVFSALDHIALKRRIFKVETVGDCYVAVSGLPEPRKDHAIVMARFARDTVLTVRQVVKRLELSLGPDTGDLGVRIGLHSGVVTAGVLRGERARFQLFGDTVNTTARIESTGARNRIHASKETADLLTAAGKGHWVRPRRDLVSAKGKGTMQTYWVEINQNNNPNTGTTASGTASTSSSDKNKSDEDDEKDLLWADAEVTNSKTDRLIDWQMDVCSRLLRQVVARRLDNSTKRLTDATSRRSVVQDPPRSKRLTTGSGKTCLDEVKEIIYLPDFEEGAARRIEHNPDEIDLGQNVMEQLRSFINAIALLYHPNDFHNFEHACHVTMSVTKLLSRIVKPADLTFDDGATQESNSSAQTESFRIAATLHERTYGITSDPLTQFSLVFSAMIHDADHTGVPNATLIQEDALLARAYHNKSVAEQNSIHLAWDLLQQDHFRDLRATIYSTNAEFERFRQLVVQTVLATDIVDQELKALRNARWDHAFEEKDREESPRDTLNRKATIVIEHLIQASDVAHTMQHWHVYRKWNENFFRECYHAYKAGRAQTDPSINWYKGELGFFDFYIIPLAKKLKKCGVFGVSSDEYLNYALTNRQEWQDRGKEVVEEMLHAIQRRNSTVAEGIASSMQRIEEDDDKSEAGGGAGAAEVFLDDGMVAEEH